MTALDDEQARLAEMAYGSFGATLAPRWLSLTRPAVRLVAADGDEPVLARLGGRPRLPADVDWLHWTGFGPLSYVAEVDLDAVTASGLDPGVGLPATGRLLAFCFLTPTPGTVGGDDVAETAVESPGGSSWLLHVEQPRADSQEVDAPAGATVFGRRSLAGRQVVTFPYLEHPALDAAFGDEAERESIDDVDYAVLAGTDDETSYCQLGGHADAVQGSVEDEVARATTGIRPGADPDPVAAEALRWAPLLQVASEEDLGMEWGDLGTLYWLVRPPADGSGSAALGPVGFTWQT